MHMKHLRACLLLLSGLLSTVSLPAATIAANASELQYEGRTAPQADGSVAMGFPGITTHLAFDGARLLVRTDASSANVYLDVSVDGGAFKRVRLPQGEGEALLFEARPGRIRGARQADGGMGVSSASGSSRHRRACSSPPVLAGASPALRRRFDHGGLRCGHRPGGSCLGRQDSRLERSQHLRLRHRTELDAQVHLVAYGGRGILRDWQGIPTPYQRMPELYERTLPDDAASRWDHSAYVPGAVVVCLGQNDFNTGIPDQVEWVQGYVEFVRKIARDFPDAKIFLVNSPMHGNDGVPRRDALIGYLEEVVKQAKLPQVSTITIPQRPGVPGDGHPTAEEHRLMAAQIAPLLKQALGW
jgi:hypothetical protein